MKMIIPFALCCFGLILLLPILGFTVAIPSQSDQAFLGALHFPPKQESPPVTLLFVGDIMLDRGVEFAVHKYGQGDWKWPFLNIADTLRQADLVFGNLESQISDKGTNIGSIYSFRADPASIEALTYAGFDVVSVANNHSFDYTREAFEDTLLRLTEAGIAYTGGGFSETEAHTPIIKEIGDLKIGFLGYTNSGTAGWAASENHGGIAWIDSSNLNQLRKDVRSAKAQVDILAVSLHAGDEYEENPNDFQKTFAKTAIDAGADLIIGHHPHVLQSLQPHKDSWIIYSLGNFLFDQDFSEETMQGAILKVVIENKQIEEVSLLPTQITPLFQVHLAK